MNDVLKGVTIALTSSLISSVVAYTIGSYRATVRLIHEYGERLTRLETTVNTASNAIEQRLERMERQQDNER